MPFQPTTLTHSIATYITSTEALALISFLSFHFFYFINRIIPFVSVVHFLHLVHLVHRREGRESTARVVVSRELNIPMSFTLEATFCGSNYGPYENCHMNVGHMQEVGASLCDTVLQVTHTHSLSVH